MREKYHSLTYALQFDVVFVINVLCPHCTQCPGTTARKKAASVCAAASPRTYFGVRQVATRSHTKLISPSPQCEPSRINSASMLKRNLVCHDTRKEGATVKVSADYAFLYAMLCIYLPMGQFGALRAAASFLISTCTPSLSLPWRRHNWLFTKLPL